MSSVASGSEPARTSAGSSSAGRNISSYRIAGLAFGALTQLLFAYTAVSLFLYLRNGSGSQYRYWWLVDLALAVGFVIPHSILLAPPTQRWLRTVMPGGLLGCVHCTVTCVTLLVQFQLWGRSETYLWNATGAAESVIRVAFYACWLALFYSLWLTGLGYQTGLTQWWYWARQVKPPKREFVTRGAYRWMRHPVYLSFLGLIWFTPQMSLDHAILTTVWTIYIYAGSYFKDLRLMHYIGQPYQDYAKQVVGLPLIGFGPLLKFK